MMETDFNHKTHSGRPKPCVELTVYQGWQQGEKPTPGCSQLTNKDRCMFWMNITCIVQVKLIFKVYKLNWNSEPSWIAVFCISLSTGETNPKWRIQSQLRWAIHLLWLRALIWKESFSMIINASIKHYIQLIFNVHIFNLYWTYIKRLSAYLNSATLVWKEWSTQRGNKCTEDKPIWLMAPWILISGDKIGTFCQNKLPKRSIKITVSMDLTVQRVQIDRNQTYILNPRRVGNPKKLW